jgi:hypothetical protein
MPELGSTLRSLMAPRSALLFTARPGIQLPETLEAAG